MLSVSIGETICQTPDHRANTVANGAPAEDRLVREDATIGPAAMPVGVTALAGLRQRRTRPEPLPQLPPRAAERGFTEKYWD